MKKRMLSILLAAAMVLTVLPTFTLSVAAEEERYLDYVDGAFTAKPLPSPLNTIDENTDEFVAGWNIVRGDVVFNNRIGLPGDANLILADGATLTAKQGIMVASDGDFAVYAQSTDEATMGKLVVPEADNYNTGIGSNIRGSCGNITIYGGILTVHGGYASAGIGSSASKSSCGDITIYGGVINTQGGDDAAGIGNGFNESVCGDITIYGGVVNAQGGMCAAGIGSGYAKSVCGNIAIYGGVVTAQGGEDAAGIGSGFFAKCGAIDVFGGVVDAQGVGYGAGIGSGASSENDVLTITGGYVCAKGGENAQDIGKGANTSSPTVSIETSCTQLTKNGATYINYEPFETTEPGCVTNGTKAYYKDYVSGNYYTAFPFTADSLIGDDAALAAWKTSGGGYVPPLGHIYEYLGFFEHVCARCGDVSGHAYHNNACGDCGITTSVKYYDYNAVSKQFFQVTIDPYMDELQGVCSSDTDVEIDGGYYIVFGNVTVNGTLTVSDDTDLILGNGAILTVTNGIVLDGGDLSVYTQTLDTAQMGVLAVTATSANQAAIAGDGDLVVNGGNVTAAGGSDAAGIGSYNGGSFGNITLNGGVIIADGGSGAAGIGCGPNGTCGTITVSETLSQFAGNSFFGLAYRASYSDNSYVLFCKGTATAAVSPTCFGAGCRAYIQNTVDARYYEISDSGAKIGDAAALAAWKAEGGAGYIAIVDHDWVAVDADGHKCTYCEDVRPHTYVNAPYICDACGYEDLKAARADAKTAFDEAAGENPTDAMNTVLNNAKAAVDAAETVADIATAKETWLPAVELRFVKDSALAAVHAVAGETPSAAVEASVNAAAELINAAETEAKVEAIKTAVLPVITAQVAAEAEAAAQTLADAKTAAKAALQAAAGEHPSAALATILSDALNDVDEAATVAAVQTAEEAGFAAILSQLADEAALEQAAAIALAEAKTAAKDALDAAAAPIGSEAQEQVLFDAKAAVDAATTPDGVAAAKASGLSAIAAQKAAELTAKIDELKANITDNLFPSAKCDEAKDLLYMARIDLDTAASIDEASRIYNTAKEKASAKDTAFVGKLDNYKSTFALAITDVVSEETEQFVEAVRTALDNAPSIAVLDGIYEENEPLIHFHATKDLMLVQCNEALETVDMSDAMKALYEMTAEKLSATANMEELEEAYTYCAEQIELQRERESYLPECETILASDEYSDEVKSLVREFMDALNAAESLDEIEYAWREYMPMINLQATRDHWMEELADLLPEEPSDAVTRIIEDAGELISFGADSSVFSNVFDVARRALERQLTAEANQKAMEDVLKQAREDIAAANATIDELRDTVKSNEATLAEKQAALDTATEQLNAAKADLETAKAALEKATEELKELQESLEVAQMALDAAQTGINKLKSTVAEQELQISQDQQEIQALQAEIDRLKALLDDDPTTPTDPTDPTDPQPEKLLGDANADGAVNMKDVLLMRKYLADNADAMNMENADCNADGEVNMKDVLMLRKYLANIIDTLGA